MIAGGLAQCIGDGEQLPAIIIGQRGVITGAVSVAGQLPAGIVAVTGDTAGRIGLLKTIPLFIPHPPGGMPQRIHIQVDIPSGGVKPVMCRTIRHHLNQRKRKVFIPLRGGAVAVRVRFGCQVTAFIVGVLRGVTQRIGGFFQFTVLIPVKKPGGTAFIGKFGDLMLFIPAAEGFTQSDQLSTQRSLFREIMQQGMFRPPAIRGL